MLTKEEFENLVNGLRGKLDETTVALVSDELLNIMSAFIVASDEFDKLKADIETLNSEKEELLKVNGKLYQRIGFDKEEEKIDNVEEIKIEDVIDEKGDLI